MKIDKHDQKNIKQNEHDMLWFKSDFKESVQENDFYKFKKRKTAKIIISNQK